MPCQREKYTRHAVGSWKASKGFNSYGRHREAGRGKTAKSLFYYFQAYVHVQFDYFHELVLQQEIPRIGTRGYGDGLNAGAVIGLPPVLNFGRPELRDRVVPEVLSGKKFICLAISEAFAGSDVMGLQTTATKTEDGKFWIINGTKKWITNGVFCD